MSRLRELCILDQPCKEERFRGDERNEGDERRERYVRGKREI